MAKIQGIKDRLVTLVSALQYNGADAFVNVFDYELDNFENYPTAVILLRDNQGDFGTTAQNDRTDVFDIHILLNLEDVGKTRQEIQNWMYDLIDLVRDGIDRSQDLSGFVTYMNPTIASPGVIRIGSGTSVDGMVSVEVRYPVDIT